MTLTLALVGLQVHVESPDAPADTVCSHLGALGVPLSVDGSSVSFPVTSLPNLADLPSTVRVVTDEDLRPVWLLCAHPSDAGLPATLDVVADRLWLRWSDGVDDFDEPVPLPAVAALVTSPLAFVATPAAWNEVRSASSLPLLAGTACLNLDGFVEIVTSRPQLVESAQLPVAFRIDDTHFGVPAAHAGIVEAHPAFAWTGPRPTAVFDRPDLSSPAVALSEASAVEAFGEHLASRSAAVVVGGDRALVAATLAASDAAPVLVVTPNYGLWPWRHLARAAGMSVSSDPHVDDVDVTVVAYDRLDAVDLDAVAAVVLDDPLGAGRLDAAHLRRLDTLSGVPRVIVCDRFDPSSTQAATAMAALRPGEFRAGVPAHQRYGTGAEDRFASHIEVYRFTSSPSRPPRRRVTLLAQTEQMAAAAAQVEARPPSDPAVLLSMLDELVSAGPAHSTSPKVSAVLASATQAAAEGRRCVVVTRHERTAALVVALARHLGAGRDAASGVVVCSEGVLPPVSAEDLVVVVDYPSSTDSLDERLGDVEVEVLHVVGSSDDVVAPMAAGVADARSLLVARTAPTRPVLQTGPPRPMIGHSV